MTSRAAPLLAALAALAGCSIDLEGAACDVPGATDQCPDGQRCGKDLKCSKRAAEASCAFCTPGETACRPGDAVGTCVAGDDVCNAWSVTACGTALVCPDGQAACQCALPGAVVGVDPERSFSATGGDLAPTGALEPPGCRFETLAPALALEGERTVRVHRRDAGAVATFDLEATLVLAAGKTLTTDEADASLFVLRASDGMPSGSDVVRLAAGATLEHFTVTSARDLGAGDGVEVDCAQGSATLTGVVISGAPGGTPWLGRGLVVTGGCTATASDLAVSGAKNEGVLVETESPLEPEPATTFTRGEISGCGGTGLAIWGGKVTARGEGASLLSVHGNGAHGVLVSSRAVGPKPLDVALERLDVHDNGLAGMIVLDAKRPANTAAVALDGLQLHGNAGASYGAGRTGGGLVLQGTGAAAPSFSMKGSVVCANGGDEVGVWSDASWSLSGDACGATSNLFLNPGDEGFFVFSTSATANVTADNDYWSANPPSGKLQGVSSYQSEYCGQPAVVPGFCN